MRTKTIDLKGKEYAQVKDRLLQFRNDNPNGSIHTEPSIQQDGSILFKAHIVKDKKDEHSAEATGHALGAAKGDKAFEKLETIAVGRALAILGYASDGEIASSEEMQEFFEYKEQQKQALITEMTERLNDCKNIEELKVVWPSVPADVKKDLEPLKDRLKNKYGENK